MDWAAFRLSVELGLWTLALLLPVSVWLGRFLAVRRFRGRGFVEAAVALPLQALQHGPAGAHVLIVDASDQVAMRPVQVGPTERGQVLVLSGLTSGERVLVEGFQRAAPGATVRPVPWQAPAAPATSR